MCIVFPAFRLEKGCWLTPNPPLIGSALAQAKIYHRKNWFRGCKYGVFSLHHLTYGSFFLKLGNEGGNNK